VDGWLRLADVLPALGSYLAGVLAATLVRRCSFNTEEAVLLTVQTAAVRFYRSQTPPAGSASEATETARCRASVLTTWLYLRERARLRTEVTAQSRKKN